jgi:hypothetical protein
MKRVERNKRLKNIALRMILPQTLYPECNKPANQILQKMQQTSKPDITSNQILQKLQQTSKPDITSNQILHQNTKFNPDLELISQQFTNLDQWLNTNLKPNITKTTTNQQTRYYIKPNITSKYQAQPRSRAHFSAIYQSRPMAKYQSQPMAKYQSQPTSL